MSAPPAGRGLTLRVLLPFAAGYYLSYVYRTVNAVIAPELGAELGLDAAVLGLLTSVYFLAFALFQLPLGLLLDRYGPRRVEAALLLVAALGALLFARAGGATELILGRALIGLGVSACLMAAFKATMTWFPAHRIPALNGRIMAAGGLGALTATRPVESALALTDWRGVILLLAALTLGVAVLIWRVSPEPPRSTRPRLRELLRGIGQIYRSALFWRVVPVVMLTQAGFMAIQGLWAGPWLRDVAGLERPAMATGLLYIALAMVAGFLLLGQCASWLNRRGVSLAAIMITGLGLFLLAQAGLILAPAVPALPSWLLFGFFGSSGILSYPLLAQYFPPELAGRVNTCVNLLVFLGAFAIQWSIGALINLWPATPAGGYPTAAYRVAFGVMLGLQLLALARFLSGWRDLARKPA